MCLHLQGLENKSIQETGPFLAEQAEAITQHISLLYPHAATARAARQRNIWIRSEIKSRESEHCWKALSSVLVFISKKNPLPILFLSPLLCWSIPELKCRWRTHIKETNAKTYFLCSVPHADNIWRGCGSSVSFCLYKCKLDAFALSELTSIMLH